MTCGCDLVYAISDQLDLMPMTRCSRSMPIFRYGHAARRRATSLAAPSLRSS